MMTKSPISSVFSLTINPVVPRVSPSGADLIVQPKEENPMQLENDPSPAPTEETIIRSLENEEPDLESLGDGMLFAINEGSLFDIFDEMREE